MRATKQSRGAPAFLTPVPVRGSISDVISNSPSLGAWEVVNKQNATPVASPSLAKGEDTFAQLAKNVLLKCPEGRTSEQISAEILKSEIKGRDLSAIKPKVSAALSSHSRGDKAIFMKGPQNEEKKQIWLLKNPSNSPLMTDESLPRIFAADGLDTTVGVGIPQENESDEQYYTTRDHVSVNEKQPAEDNSETNEDDATTLPDTISVGIAQIINNVIASAGHTPPPGVSNGPAAALAVEPSQHSHLHELQQACPPSVNRLEVPSAPDPQPSVQESGRAVSTRSPSSAFVMADGPVSAPQHIAVEREPTESVAREVQTAPTVQDVSPERALPLHLAAMIGMHVKNFIDRHQQQPPVFQKYLSSYDQGDGDAQAALKDIVRRLGANTTLGPTLSQPVNIFQDAQRAFDDFIRARAMEGAIDVAIVDCNVVQAAMNAEIERLKQVVADLDSAKRSLQDTKTQAVASMKSSRERIKAFVMDDQDNNGQNID
ncbi:hypothetical protein KCU99_g8112, partial [Aureobasidium melanogenum]